MSNRKQLRRLTYLCSIHHPPYTRHEYILTEKKKQLAELTAHFNGTPMGEQLEMIVLFEGFGYNDKEAFAFWRQAHSNHRLKSAIYSAKPVRERKDNKDVINWGGGSSGSRNRIRYPKKVRKTAWKRFYKLFPHLKKAS